MKYIIVAAIALTIGAAWEHSVTPDYRGAMSICDKGHYAQDVTEADEQACAKAQAATNTEYICTINGDCHLEVK